MASLQRYTSRGHTYWRLVESYRRADGKPAIRTLAQIGKADDLAALLAGHRDNVAVRSVSSGAVDAVWRLASGLEVAKVIDEAIVDAGGRIQMRDGLTVGQSLLAVMLGRLCHPGSKRAFASWASQTSLPAQLRVQADVLTSQHFWDQMDSVPVAALAKAEALIVEKLLSMEQIAPGLLAYDTTNFFTYIATPNSRNKLAQRGHNKQRRNDLRQFGLALIVSEEGQIPLGHALYEGARSDVKTFAKEIDSLRSRMRTLFPRHQQMTFVFDQGAESTDNLAALRDASTYYVTCLKPSHHKAWLEEVAGKLKPLKLSNGNVVRAHREPHPVHGVEQTVVVVWSKELYDGQRRGYEADLQKACDRLKELNGRSAEKIESVRLQAQKACNKQYLRESLSFEIRQEDKRLLVVPLLNMQEHKRLLEQYFGLRVLTTNHAEWTTEQIIEAYRGQSRVEHAFRDLKDPWVCALRPQFHWTDQKIRVHAFASVMALILGRLLHHRMKKAVDYRGSLRNLIQQLEQIRTATLATRPLKKGKPKVHTQLEEMAPELRKLAIAAGLL